MSEPATVIIRASVNLFKNYGFTVTTYEMSPMATRDELPKRGYAEYGWTKRVLKGEGARYRETIMLVHIRLDVKFEQEYNPDDFTKFCATECVDVVMQKWFDPYVAVREDF